MKKILAVFLAVVMTFMFSACGNNSGTSSSINPDSEGSKEQVTYYKNPLTGEKTLTKSEKDTRPVGVMINNIRISLPQRGISKADVFYEVPAEGGITRILALFKNVDTIVDTGSLRSARSYYFELACSHNAIFAHFGGEAEALTEIKNSGIKTINFMTTSASYRDPNRLGKIPLEHTAFTDGNRLKKAIEKRGIKTEAKIKDFYNFGDNSSVFAEADAATTVNVPYSLYKTNFKYNAEKGLYEKNQLGAPQIDSTTGETLSVKNVFVLKTEMGLKGGSKGYINVDLSEGNGYYAVDGKIIPVKWEKNGFNNQLKYYTMDGKELKVSEGKTWVCIVEKNATVSYS